MTPGPWPSIASARPARQSRKKLERPCPERIQKALLRRMAVAKLRRQMTYLRNSASLRHAATAFVVEALLKRISLNNAEQRGPEFRACP